ncbi:elongation factor P [Novosphingobium sp.]|uniref:elongation factor P n=1 Tax=Novosphingobium sp. TaxID=1874826 RepID=UPI0025D14192|nr:elongation factor P [Novosphingobium sp.]MCC6925785.1 elongation factor P [Novosphingobium sp.]
MTKHAAILLLALAAPAAAVPGGPIGQIPPGNFLCEMPGDATGAVGLRVQAEDFAVVNANTYRTASGRGSYLLTGDRLTFTSGPKNGQKFHLISGNFLRKLGSDGQDSQLRCVRRVVNNS